MPDFEGIRAVELLVAACLLSVNLFLSWLFRLGIGKSTLWAAARMTVQLLIVGRLLTWVFQLERPSLVFALALLMSSLAGLAAVGRTSQRFPGINRDSILCVTVSAFSVTSLTLSGILHVEPWWSPQYLIPLLGMVLGNALTGISLALDRFMDGLTSRRHEVEGLLSLGATKGEASRDELRHAMRVGMIPTLNSMAVMGVVSLPGVTTGQILAGADPSDAVNYQIVIMFMIASAAALGILGVTLLASRALFDKEHRLRLDRLSPPKHRTLALWGRRR